jgi:hypothetical protein
MLIRPHIVISAWTHKAKTYPHWHGLVEILRARNYLITQVGVGSEEKLPGIEHVWDKSLKEVEDVVRSIGDFVSIDNFLHHLAHSIGVRGTVIWGPSDPNIYGYGSQINIIKHRKYLRPDQFGFYRGWVWPYEKEGWYGPKEVADFITHEGANTPDIRVREGEGKEGNDSKAGGDVELAARSQEGVGGGSEDVRGSDRGQEGRLQSVGHKRPGYSGR